MSSREVSLDQNLVLTKVVQGKPSQESEFVGDFISPKVPVPVPQGQIVEFDNSNQVLYDTRRVPGAETKRRRIGYFGRPYKLVQDSLEGELPMEVIRDSTRYGRMLSGTNIAVPFNLERHTVLGTQESLNLRLEYDRAQLLTNPANYDPNNVVTLSGSDVLNDPNSTIIELFDQVRERVSDKSLKDVNRAVFSRKAFNAAINHPQIRAYFTGVSSEVVMEQQLARILRLKEIRVAKAKKLIDGTTEDFEAIWGNNIIVAYVPETLSPDRLEPAFSYTYQLEGYPMVEEPYSDRNCKSMYYPVTDERNPYIVGLNSGFLIQNATNN